MTHAGERFYLAYDQVGSLRAVTDASGAMVKAVTYDSFGTVLEDTNPPLDLPFGFAGGLHDADTGLVRFGYRDYAPEVGRWTAKDPIGFGGGDSDLYGYCGNGPVKNVDPDGRFALAAQLVRMSPLIIPGACYLYKAIKESIQILHKAGEDDDCGEDEEGDSNCPDYPGDDPTKAPEGFEWKGKPGSKPGSKEGNYHNPETGENLSPASTVLGKH